VRGGSPPIAPPSHGRRLDVRLAGQHIDQRQAIVDIVTEPVDGQAHEVRHRQPLDRKAPNRVLGPPPLVRSQEHRRPLVRRRLGD
jgi:hypothetical protein